MFSSRKKAIGTAHSKLILIGEHAVVYGHPAIALPFPSLKVTCVVESAEENIFIEGKVYSGPLEKIPDRLKGMALCIEKTLEEIGKSYGGLKLTIDSKIPIGRGLGSSASIAIAIVRGLFRYFQVELTKNKLMELVTVAEKYAHGNPSGIDMEAVYSDEPIWFKKGKPIESISIQSPFYLVVADTGRIGDTKKAVESIKEKQDRDPFLTNQSIDKLKSYTEHARHSLLNGEIIKLGNLMNLAQTELESLGVSDEGINHLVEAAREIGALGAKLTGGGRGGCIIALAKNNEQAQKICSHLSETGANDTWSFKVQDSEKYKSFVL